MPAGRANLAVQKAYLENILGRAAEEVGQVAGFLTAGVTDAVHQGQSFVVLDYGRAGHGLAAEDMDIVRPGYQAAPG